MNAAKYTHRDNSLLTKGKYSRTTRLAVGSGDFEQDTATRNVSIPTTGVTDAKKKKKKQLRELGKTSPAPWKSLAPGQVYGWRKCVMQLI